jgi:two-component system, OmpR family, sensor kinase
VVLSGSDESVALEALNEGAQDYLRKGDVDGEMLGRSLRYAILRQEVRDRERLLAHEHAARVAAEEAVEARDEFLATAAHELRTPLTALMLRVAQLERSARARAEAQHPDCGTCSEKLESGARQLERLKHLVNSLLDVARITSGRVVLDRQDVDLAAVAHGAAREFKPEAAAAGSSLRVDAPAPVVGRWDLTSVEQIVANLLSNAVKYGAGEPVELAVRGVDRSAVLTVKDRGIGIAPEDVARIFDRFERAVSVRHYGGLGLGLFIVRQLAEAHGGSVAVESRPGEGSTFTVRLPMAAAPALA